METLDIMKAAKTASKSLFTVCEDTRNKALLFAADELLAQKAEILLANGRDIKNAEGKINTVMLDRLRLTSERIDAMAAGVREVAALDCPTGRILSTHTRPDGLVINKVSVPLGVVAIIYESRPNVTSDAAALCIKSGNACILRCGKEAHESARAVTAAIKDGIARAGLARECVMLVDDTTRESANALMRGNGYIDLLIPRGGKGLISACVENATVPCIETGTGICHIYVDKDADFDMALNIIENAKTSRPSVCNAAECCLIDKSVVKDFVPLLEKRLYGGAHPVTLYMDECCYSFASGAQKADRDSFDTEFLDYKMAVAAVDGVAGAISHIDAHSTHHSEAIITNSKSAADAFCAAVDSAAVYVNASTRFTDGGEFGLGCEMGISTQKLHARGPMGLAELTTYKYVVCGNGNIR